MNKFQNSLPILLPEEFIIASNMQKLKGGIEDKRNRPGSTKPPAHGKKANSKP